MLDREEILKKLLKIQAYLANQRLEKPDSEELRDSKILLDDLETEFYKGWPIEDTEVAASVGVYADRVLSDGPNKDLAEMMIDLAGDMDAGI